MEELSQLEESLFGDPLHSLIIVGKRVHHLEIEYAGQWAVDQEGEDGRDKSKAQWWRVAEETYAVKDLNK